MLVLAHASSCANVARSASGLHLSAWPFGENHRGEQNGLTRRVELKNLKPGKRYFFEVETGQAKGTHGGEVESNRFAFRTPGPGQPPISNEHPEGARF